MSTVRTDHVDTMVPDYLAGRLGGADAEYVERHLAVCARCRSEADEMRQTFAVLDSNRVESPSSSYFAGLLPRIHERIEVRSKTSWLDRLVIGKVALPLAALTLAVAFLVRTNIPAPVVESSNPLRSVLASVPKDEALDALMEETIQSAVSQSLNQDVAETLLTDRVQRKAVRHALRTDRRLVVEEIPSASIEDDLKSLDDKQVDDLLQRLGERTFL